MESLLRFQNALSRPTVPLLSRLNARIELDGQNMPMSVSGAECVVFRLTRRDGSKLALRLPIEQNTADEWPVRYAALKGFRHPAIQSRLPGDYEVIRNALAVESGQSDGGIERVTALATDWIDGPTLISAADRAAHTGNVQILRALAKAVRDAANDLRTSGFIHGDVTASNLLVRTSGQIAFVDLDRTSWPGSPLGAIGSGSPNYRHPGGTASTAHRDSFALLVIYASLLALAERPDRRRSWGDPVSTPDAALLLTEWDLGAPKTSECVREIKRSASQDVVKLFEALERVLHEGPESVSRHLDAIPGLVPLQHPDGQSGLIATTWDLNVAVRRVRDRFDQAPESVPRKSSPAVDVEHPTWISQEEPSAAFGNKGDVQELRIRLKKAIADGNEAEVARLWSRLSRDPVARTMTLDVETLYAKRYAERIDRESRQGRDTLVISIGDEARQRRIPLPAASRSAIRSARDRVEVRSRLDHALATDSRDHLADLAVSGQLVVLGDTDRRSLVRVLQALEWPSLKRALDTDDDRMIINSYDHDLFEGSDALPQSVAERVILARSRLQWADRTRAALHQRLASEVVALFDRVPDRAESHLSSSERRRAHKIVEQQRAMRQLAEAIQGRDESEIVSALAVVERVGARLGEHFPWHAIRDVLERVSLIEDLIEAARSRPIDHVRLAQLIPAARAIGLGADSRLSGELDLDALQIRVIQAAHLRRVRAALERDDDAGIVVAAIPDVYDVLDDLNDEERDRVTRAIRSQRRQDRHAIAARFET